MKGADHQEKLVYQIIEDAGNKGNICVLYLLLTHWPLGDIAIISNFKSIVQNSSLETHCEIALRGMSHNLPIVNSSLAQIIDWCCQATGHCLSKCWVVWQVLCCHMASLGHNWSTHKQLETHECILSTMGADALVLKHQAISIHSAD